MITSIRNERVRCVRSLDRRRVRRREGRFVVEGTRSVGEMVRAGVKPSLVLFTEAWSATAHAQRLLPTLSQADEGAWMASEDVLAACADTVTSQGVLAVVPWLDLPSRDGLVLILDRLRDPGNAGTILRSAEAAGAGLVVLAPGTVDLYNPKVVRGAMGAHFRLPTSSLDWPDITERVRGRAIWLADASGDLPYDAVNWMVPSALIIGGEASGTGEHAANLATGRVVIPMPGGAESLNAAMAATVILFEAARQQRTRGE